jgi:transcription initiation factor TFIIB
MNEEPLIDAISTECRSCGSSQLIRYSANNRIVCLDCGIVIDAEKSKSDLEPKHCDKIQKKRNGESISASAKIGEDVSEFPTTDNHRRHSILQQWNERAKASDQTEKNIVLALTEITRIARCLSISPNVLETASELYKRCVEKRLIKGRSIWAFSAATLYIAYRQCGYMRTLDEVAKYSKMNRKAISRCYRVLRKELNCRVPPVNLSQYTETYLGQLGIEGKMVAIAQKILKLADESKLTSGKNPHGTISAAIYIASKLVGAKRTQREISELTHVTQTCIRNRCNELEKRLSFVMTL